MKLEYTLYDGIDAYAKLTYTFKGTQFELYVGELIDSDQQTQNVFAVFRTHLGKYKHGFKASPECVNDLSEDVFCNYMCDVAYDSFVRKFGEIKPQ